MIDLLKTLSLTNGVSGNEEAVRQCIIEKIAPWCTYQVDAMGNVLAFKKGEKAPDKKLLLTAHMDEVGMIVTGVTDEGFLRFTTVGGVDPRVLFGISVLVAGQVNGVIGGKALHHLSAADQEKSPVADELLIDIGAQDRNDALQVVSVGDFVSFQSDFYPFGEGLLKGKALDDRIGCALLIRLLQKDLPFDTHFAFLVQEEVGLRGAKAAAYTIQPDIALVLEATTAADLSGVHGDKRVCVLGNGPVISFMDGRTIYDKQLYQLALETAGEACIKCQPKTAVAGGNDAGAIHLSGKGVRTLAISLACRYIHTPSCVVCQSDLEETERLLEALLPKLYTL